MRPHISGQAIVTIDGQDFYLGKFGSPEAHAKYALLIKRYQVNGLKLPGGIDAELETIGSLLAGLPVPKVNLASEPIIIAHLTATYRVYLEERYATVENKTEHKRLKYLCDELDRNDGKTEVTDYGPRALAKQRQRWVDSGKSRMYCNRLTHSVVRMFKWGVAQELVEESTWTRLTSLESLRMGATTAHDNDPIGPVAIEVVRATAKELSPVLRAMIRIHIATGMRPSELCRMRPCEVDRSGEVWMYRPKKHKTANKRKHRAIPIVGDAREALTDFLNRDANSYCFSPIESMAWHQAIKRSQRKSKVQPSQVDRSKNKPSKKPRDHFDAHSYRQSIQRAAKRAEVESWHPYQLRHLAATTIREALGIEGVKSLLGHSQIAMSEHYARITEGMAIEAAHAAPKL